MERPPVGTIVTIDAIYPDGTGSKKRPALIVARSSEDECFMLEVTSQPQVYPNGTLISPSDFLSGGLSKVSQVRSDRIFTAHDSLISKEVGRLHAHVFSQILQKTLKLFPKPMSANA